MRSGSRKSRATEKWQKLIERHRASGMSVRSYCRKKGVLDSGFYVWRKRLAGKAGGDLKDFIKINAPASVRMNNVVQIRTPGGYCLDVPVGTGGDFLKEVLSVLSVLE